MKDFIKFIYQGFTIATKSKFKYLLLLFALWLFRIEFIPDVGGGGAAKALQVGCLAGMLCMIVKWYPSIVSVSFGKTNAAVKSALWLYLFALLSTLWAFDPRFAFFLSFQNIVLIMTLVFVYSRFHTFRSTEMMFVLFVSIMIIFESICIRFTQRVLIAHFLPAASSAAMLFSYSIAEYLNASASDRKRKKILRYAIILSVVILLTCTSGGANASAAFGLSIALFFSKKRIYAIPIFAIAAFFFLNQDLLNELITVLMPGKTKEVIESGNGRDSIWELIFRLAEEKPWLGWGFACVERVMSEEAIKGQILSDAHNSYIGIYGSLGIVGCVFLGTHIANQLTTIYPRIRRRGYTGLLAASGCALLNCYTYGFLSGKACSITVTYFSLVVLTFYYKKLAKSNDNKNT